jgi:hypothetical protein
VPYKDPDAKRAHNRKGVKAYREKHKALGLCTSCPKPAFMGTTMCKEHTLKHKIYYLKYNKEKSDYKHAQFARRKERLKSEGRCIECGAKLIEEETGLKCVNCAEAHHRLIKGVLHAFNG